MFAVKYAERTGTWTTPAGHTAHFVYREDTNDWNTVSACLHDDEYALPRDLSGIALDIGAHIGAVSVALALDNPDMHVIAIEPVPDNVRLLWKNIEANLPPGRVTIISGMAGGLGQKEGTVRYGFRGSEIAEHHTFIGNAYLVPELTVDEQTITLRSWSLSDLAPGSVTFAKVDIEGGEYALLCDPTVERIAIIAGEWHNIEGHVRGDLLHLLSLTHHVTFSGPIVGPGAFRAVRR